MKNILKIKFFMKLFVKFKLFIFLLRLLFTSHKKIRFLLFDTLHLKQFFDLDNWQEILKIILKIRLLIIIIHWKKLNFDPEDEMLGKIKD